MPEAATFARSRRSCSVPALGMAPCSPEAAKYVSSSVGPKDASHTLPRAAACGTSTFPKAGPSAEPAEVLGRMTISTLTCSSSARAIVRVASGAVSPWLEDVHRDAHEPGEPLGLCHVAVLPQDRDGFLAQVVLDPVTQGLVGWATPIDQRSADIDRLFIRCEWVQVRDAPAYRKNLAAIAAHRAFGILRSHQADRGPLPRKPLPMVSASALRAAYFGEQNDRSRPICWPFPKPRLLSGSDPS